MKQNKNTFRIIVAALVAIWGFAIFSCTNNKKKDEAASTTIASTKAANDTFRVRPLTNIKYERTAERLKRGEYLTTSLLECFMCHSERDWKSPGAPPIKALLGSGKILYEDSTMRLAPPNITPDKETGAGTWTDDMFARAIREGVGHDGRALSQAMPYNSFKRLSDEDLASVIVYLRSLPPVHNVVLPTKMSSGERAGTERGLRPITAPVSAPDFSDSIKLGGYLVRLASCGDCHTSRANYNPGAYAGGNLLDHGHGTAFSLNITYGPSGIDYGPEGFIFVMRTGKGGTLSNNMPWAEFKKPG